MKNVNALPAIDNIRLRKREAEKIHAGFMKLGWTHKQLHEASGVSLYQVSRFVRHKQATLRIGQRYAIAISTALLLDGKHERYEDRQTNHSKKSNSGYESRTRKEK